jgi:hypothetical protein
VAIRTPRRALEKTMRRVPIESRLIERAVTSPAATRSLLWWRRYRRGVVTLHVGLLHLGLWFLL